MASDDVYVIAKYDYNGQDRQELRIKKHERLILLDDSKQWWKVENSQHQSGFVPSNYVKKCKPSILASLRNTLTRRKSTSSSGHYSTAAGSSGGGSLGHRSGDSQSESSAGSDPYNAGELVDTFTVARYPYETQQPDELQLSKGERVIVIEKSNDGWWRGRKDTGEVGWFPSNYMELADGEGSETYALPELSSYCDASLTRTNREILETVATLYPFESSSREELSFDKDERLDILEKPDVDPEWWKAQNARGKIGLVPRNYVQTLSSTDSGFQQTTPESLSSSSIHAAARNGNVSCSRSLSAASAGGARPVWKNNAAEGAAAEEHNPSRVVAEPGLYSSRDWFFVNITRSECENMLNSSADTGDFIIRESETHVSVRIIPV